MELNSDSPLLETIVESLQLSNSDSAILSTCNFLQTVVVFDFPADVFLYHRELFIVTKILIDWFSLVWLIFMSYV